MAKDIYLGDDTITITADQVVAGAAGYFRVAKVGDRFVFVTPLDHPFWMRALYVVDSAPFTAGTVTNKYVLDPTLTASEEWAKQIGLRMQSWGFNALGEYWGVGTQPVAPPSPGTANATQMPFIDYRTALIYCVRAYLTTDAAEHTSWLMMKNLVNCGRDHQGGMDAGATNPGPGNSFVYTDYQGKLADVFDPVWPTSCALHDDRAVNTRYADTAAYPTLKWLIGISNDDTDLLWGVKKLDSMHAGWLCAVTSPFQALNWYNALGQPHTQLYTDKRSHTKFAFREWLVGRYGTATPLAVTVSTSTLDATFSGAHGLVVGDFLKLTSGDDSGEIRRISAVPTTATATLERQFTTDQTSASASKIPAAGALSALNAAWGSSYTTIDGEDITRTAEPLREVLNPLSLTPVSTTATSTAITSSQAPVSMSHVYAEAGQTAVTSWFSFTGCTWTTASSLVTVGAGLQSTDVGLKVILVGGGPGGTDIERTISDLSVTNGQFHYSGDLASTAKTGDGVVKLYRGGFTAGDVNALITIPGAGGGGADLNTRVATVTDSGHFTVADAAGTTVTDAVASLGRGPFASTYVGRMLSIPGAGVAGAALHTGFAAVTDPTHATIGTAATGTVTNVAATMYRAVTMVADRNGRGYQTSAYASTQYDYPLWGVGETRLDYTGIIAQKFRPYDPDNMKNTVTVKVGGVTVATDDGAGNLTGAGIASGTVDYTNAQLSLTFSAGNGPTDGADITVDYVGNGWNDTTNGTGLLDESGKNPWMAASTNSSNWATLHDQNYVTLPWMAAHYPNVKADLDAFYEPLCDRIFKYSCGTIRNRYPNHLVFSPFAMRWNARPLVWSTLSRYCDVLQVSAVHPDETFDVIKPVYEAAHKPIFLWVGQSGNADSEIGYPPVPDSSTNNFATQALRGDFYKRWIEAALNMRGSDGVAFVIGVDYWALCDNTAEGINWGILTYKDNAYDGAEAIVAAGTDAWGYATGGEAANYGNFLTWATRAHEEVDIMIGTNLTGPKASVL